MHPKKREYPLEEYLKPILVNIIDENHPLCKLSHLIDWEKLEKEFGKTYSDNGRPGKPIRLMIGLNYLKYTYDLSDEEVVYRWIENPYWQYFTGETVFQTSLPIEPSSMTRFRKRLNKGNLTKLLSVVIESGFKSGYLKATDVNRVNVDTTVQEKNVSYPVDIKLYFKLIEYLNRFAKQHNIKLKQTYLRVCKKLLRRYGGHIHSKQFKRAKRLTEKVRTNMGRLYRDLSRKLTEELLSSEEFKVLSNYYESLSTRSKKSKNKLYSLRYPEVECISKGKYHKKYEFGNKVGVVMTLTKNFLLGIVSFSGNPHDSKTLLSNLKEAEHLLGELGKIKEAFVDLGYRGHNYNGDIQVNIVPRNLKNFKRSFQKLLKKRAAVEAGISHLKRKSRLDRNFLKGQEGNKINALLSGCGHNLRMLLAYLLFFLKNLAYNFAYNTQKILELVKKQNCYQS